MMLLFYDPSPPAKQGQYPEQFVLPERFHGRHQRTCVRGVSCVGGTIDCDVFELCNVPRRSALTAIRFE